MTWRFFFRLLAFINAVPLVALNIALLFTDVPTEARVDLASGLAISLYMLESERR